MIGCIRHSAIALVLVLLASAQYALAQSWITGIPQSGLRLYSEPDVSKRAGELKSNEVQLPLQLIESEGDFGRIATPNGTFWVDLRKAQVKRSVAAECARPAKGLAQSRSQVSTAGTRGAADACPR